MASTSNRASIGVIREGTPGTIPASPAFQLVRVKSGGLTAAPQTVKSQEVRSDGMEVDTAIVGKNIAGQLDMEWTKKVADMFIEEAIRSTFTKSPEVNGAGAVAISGVYNYTAGPVFPVGSYVKFTGYGSAANNGFFRVTAQSAGQITTDNAGSVVEASPPVTSRIKSVGFKAAANGDISASTSGGNHLTSVLNPATFGLVPGMWFKALNFATAANNGQYRVSSITGAGPYTINCDVVPTGFATDTAAAAKVVVSFTDYVRNGTTRLTHATEKTFNDAAGGAIYGYRLGDQTGQFTWDMQKTSILDMTAQFIAMDTIIDSTTRFAGASSVAAGSAPVVNSSTGLQRIAEALSQLNGGTQNLPLGCKIMLNGNLRPQPAAGQIALAGVGFGTLEVTGEFDAYLDSPVYLAKLWNNTVSSFDVRAVDANGDGSIIDIPTMKYENGDDPMPAQNQDVTPKMAFRGLITTPSAGAQYVIHVQNFEAVS